MAAKKLKVTFLETRVVQNGLEGTENETRFEKGEAYSLPVNSARRWISRGVALSTSDYLKEHKNSLQKPTAQKKKAAQVENDDLTKQLGIYEEQINNLTKQLGIYEGQINNLTKQLGIYEGQIDRCRILFVELGLKSAAFDRLIDCSIAKSAFLKQVVEIIGQIGQVKPETESETDSEPAPEPETSEEEAAGPENLAPVDTPVEGDDALFGVDDKTRDNKK